MGLDISTLKNPKFLVAYADAEEDEPVDPETGDYASLVWQDGDRPQGDGFAEGYYTGEVGHGFRAGSYSSYNYVREKLSELALGVQPREVWENPSAYEGKPLYELVNFSDCEGFIGPKTSAKLLTDLNALDLGQLEEYPRRVAEDFKIAFKEAADSGGFVRFH